MSRFKTCHPEARTFLLRHGLLIPAALALGAWMIEALGIDRSVTSFFFDPASADFPARGWTLLELLGHRLAKWAVITLWLALLVTAITLQWMPRLAGYRTVLWTTVGAMAAGPLIVVALKSMNATHCPWDLKDYGGHAVFENAWFVTAAGAGQCFPSGHAAGGFSLVACYFALRAAGCRRLERAALASTLGSGLTFSIVRIAQGAHFLSHNLWSAAVVWSAAALVFTPLVAGSGLPER